MLLDPKCNSVGGWTGVDLEWDERKRIANIAKHRLDFADAVFVLDSDAVLRLPVLPAMRCGIARSATSVAFRWR